MRDHEFTELVNGLEVICQRLLQLLSLTLQKRVFTEVKHLLTQKLENVESVFALRLRLTRRLADIGDEVLPRNQPLLLDDGDECDIQLRNQMLLRLLIFIFRHLQHQLNNALSNPLFLLVRQDLPSRLHKNNIGGKNQEREKGQVFE